MDEQPRPQVGEQRMITLNDFLTVEEFDRCVEWYHQPRLVGTKSFAQQVHDEIIAPNLERIKRQLNAPDVDPKYLSYCVEHVLNRMRNAAQQEGKQ